VVPTAHLSGGVADVFPSAPGLTVPEKYIVWNATSVETSKAYDRGRAPEVVAFCTMSASGVASLVQVAPILGSSTRGAPICTP